MKIITDCLTLHNWLVLVYARLVINYINIVDPHLPCSAVFSQVNAISVINYQKAMFLLF